MIDDIKWHKRFLDLAQLISSWSKDPSTQVGAVIVRPNKTIASLGYNGFPRGIDDSYSRLNDRETKYKYIVHGDLNAILNAREMLIGYTMYIHPMFPCTSCTLAIIQSGIKQVVSRSIIPERWKENISLSLNMLKEAGVQTNDLD